MSKFIEVSDLKNVYFDKRPDERTDYENLKVIRGALALISGTALHLGRDGYGLTKSMVNFIANASICVEGALEAYDENGVKK